MSLPVKYHELITTNTHKIHKFGNKSPKMVAKTSIQTPLERIYEKEEEELQDMKQT